jgi:hypothetical protein
VLTGNRQGIFIPADLILFFAKASSRRRTVMPDRALRFIPADCFPYD